MKAARFSTTSGRSVSAAIMNFFSRVVHPSEDAADRATAHRPSGLALKALGDVPLREVARLGQPGFDEAEIGVRDDRSGAAATRRGGDRAGETWPPPESLDGGMADGEALCDLGDGALSPIVGLHDALAQIFRDHDPILLHGEERGAVED